MWRLRDLLAVVLLGAGVAAAVAALIGGAAVSVIRAAPFLPEVRDWWIGDALGILVVTPLVLAWGTRRLHGARARSGSARWSSPP